MRFNFYIVYAASQMFLSVFCLFVCFFFVFWNIFLTLKEKSNARERFEIEKKKY
jgi:hypothetical protein